jgi:hypothetical protein
MAKTATKSPDLKLTLQEVWDEASQSFSDAAIAIRIPNGNVYEARRFELVTNRDGKTIVVISSCDLEPFGSSTEAAPHR